eukprot:2104014-Prymnesium_polylepis.1
MSNETGCTATSHPGRCAGPSWPPPSPVGGRPSSWRCRTRASPARPGTARRARGTALAVEVGATRSTGMPGGMGA